MVKVVTQQPTPPAAPSAPSEPTGAGLESLDAIAAEAQQAAQLPQEAMQAQAMQEQQQQAQQEAKTASELIDVAKIVRSMALPLLPDDKRERIAAAWSDQVLKDASEAGAKIMVLHGWTLGEALGKYGPYIALAAAVAPPTLTTIRIMKEQPQEGPANGQQQQA